MYGQEKSKLRLMALDKMKKDKPMLAFEKKEEMMAEEGGEGMVSMPVSQEEREMILAMRKKMGMGEGMMDDEEQELA